MVDESVEALVKAVDGLCALEPARLGGGDAVVALARQLERLGAVVTRATAAFDAGREWESDGAKTCGAWVAARCRLPMGVARRRVRLGRCLRSMPATEAAWLEGDVGEAAVAVLAELRERVGGEAFDPDEGMLVGHARALDDRSFRKAAAYWLQHADPDGVEHDAQAQGDSRRLHLSQSLEGMWYGDLVLDPISGAVAADALERNEKELFEADWAEAKNRECYSEFCTEPARHCQIDHIDPHALGGLTEEANGRPACSFHNRWRQKRQGAGEDGSDGDQDAA